MNSWWRGLSHDARVVILSLAIGLPGGIVAMVLLWFGDHSPQLRWSVSAAILAGWIGLTMALRDQVSRPLGTLANMLAALREGDFSIRARVGDSSDPLSLAYMEVNALEEVLRDQRLGAVEATETLRKVLEEIHVAVFAFDPEGTLRIVNRAGERLLGQRADHLIGKTAADLRLEGGLEGPAPRTIEVTFPGGTGRWELRRSVVRQEGYPLQLLALSDLSRALREEERQAWKRIIRVLSHEINNSLAPIKSISGSLQGMLSRAELPEDLAEDVERGLQVVSSRAEALGRFMASYAKLARLPAPERDPLDVGRLVERVAHLDTRLPVRVEGGEEEVLIHADADQLEQALINLIRNAVDASLESGTESGVRLRWLVDGPDLHILVEDEGPGLGETGNLFVPFFTTKPGGSGIGLVLSRQIAESHGGSLVLENRPEGRGARARMILPTGSPP